MRVRTFFSILGALVVVVVASYLTHHNIDLFSQRFELTSEISVPLWVALLATFLAGLLPAGLVLLFQTLQRDLSDRRRRKRSREKRSQRGSFRRAVDLQADGRWTRAQQELEALLVERPEDFETMLRYGEVLRRQGRAEEALEVHQRASVLYPQSTAILYQMADDYEALGQDQVALQIRDRVLRDFPNQGLSVLRRRRRRAIDAEDWREAARLQDRLDAMLEADGESDDREREHRVRLGLTYQRALERMSEDRSREAREILQALLEETPDFLPAAIMLGEVELMLGSDRAALSCWTEAYDRLGDPVLLQRIEDHFIEREQPREAIEMLHQLISSAENDLLPRFFLGRLYYRLEMHDEALQVLTPLAERIEASPSYHLLLARIHHRRGRTRDAAEQYLACVREIGLTAEYRCRACSRRHDAWRDRCPDCGSWNSIELDFEEERVSAADLGVQRGPVWSIPDAFDPPDSES